MFVFIDIWVVKQDIQKWLISNKDMQFSMENLEMNRKRQKKIYVFFPPTIWIFMEGEGEEIKIRHASKRDRTLLTCKSHSPHWSNDKENTIVGQTFSWICICDWYPTIYGNYSNGESRYQNIGS